jgi:nicotinate-nucleotide adenylyltransferase
VKIGVFGGTFDPPHTGHLIVAQDAALALGLDRVLFVPAARPPHKLAADVTAPPLRARMLQLALEGDVRFGMDTLELDRTGPSYTVDTLVELRSRMAGAELSLLLGADQYADLHTWREPQRIRELATLAILERAGSTGGILAPGEVSVNVTRIDISATEIRGRVAAGLPIRYLVPAAVEDFIRQNGLYR